MIGATSLVAAFFIAQLVGAIAAIAADDGSHTQLVGVYMVIAATFGQAIVGTLWFGVRKLRRRYLEMRAAAFTLLWIVRADSEQARGYDEPDGWDCICGDHPAEPDITYGCPRCRVERAGLLDAPADWWNV